MSSDSLNLHLTAAFRKPVLEESSLKISKGVAKMNEVFITPCKCMFNARDHGTCIYNNFTIIFSNRLTFFLFKVI